MKKLIKRICTLGGIFVLIGGILFGVGILGAKGHFKNLSHLKTQTYAYAEKTENQIDNVTIAYESSANVRVHFSDTAKEVSVSYGKLLTKNGKSAGTVTLTDADGDLQIKETRNRKEKFRALAWSTAFTKINVDVTLPSDRTYALAIYTDTGNVSFDGTACNLTSLKIIGDTTDIYLQNTDIACVGNVQVETDTGDIKIGNLSATDISIETDTGDCEIYGKLSADSIGLVTDTGDVETDKNGILDAQNIFLETDTGDVSVKLAGSAPDYTIRVEVDTGKTNVHTQVGGERKLTVEVDTGDVYVSFEK